MSARDVRVDAYIAKAAPFARPILENVRATVHAGCPAVEETIKWGFPHVEWITEAKRDETRKRRVEAAASMIAAGQTRNAKYAAR